MRYPVDSAIQPLNNRGLVRVAQKVDNTIYWIYLYLNIELLLSYDHCSLIISCNDASVKI